MNWLAHIFLSEFHIDFKIGNYLADPLKGKLWEGASEPLIKGMKVHKIIDSYTDNHSVFKQSKQRLGNKGLLKGVVIDLTYDYLLTKNWNQFCNIPLDDFLQEFYKQSYATLPTLPSSASASLKRMIDFDLLNKYQHLEHLKQAFQRVDKRLSVRLKERDQVSRYHTMVCNNIEEIEKDFLEFFPQLCNKVKENINQRNLHHWKI